MRQFWSTAGVLGASAGEQEFSVRMQGMSAWMKEKVRDLAQL